MAGGFGGRTPKLFGKFRVSIRFHHASRSSTIICVPETSATTDSPKEWPRVTEASSRPSVATPQHHHVKKNRHKKRHADERI